MEQTFEYPNLLTGTRSGAGWDLAGGKPVMADQSAYRYGPVLPCYNSAATETYLWSPPVTLHRDTDYVLSFLAASTGNLIGIDVHVLDVDTSYVGWIGAEMSPEKPGGGVAGTPFRSASRGRRTTARRTRYGSTTTAPRTARTQSSGSTTSCSPRARSRMRGHRQRGRCGLSER